MTSYLLIYSLLSSWYRQLYSSAVVGNTLFDASQYAFFGKGIAEDIDLGGLEDDESGNASFARIDNEYYFPTVRDREEIIPSGGHDNNEVLHCDAVASDA